TDWPGEVHASFFDIGPFARGVADPKPPEKWTEILRSLSDYYPPPERATLLRFAKPPESSLLAAARALPDVRTYLAFARFPLLSLAPENGGATAVPFEALRFLPWFSGPWQRAPGGGLRGHPFVSRVRFAASGRVLDRPFVVPRRFGRG